MTQWIWQYEQWPDFQWDKAELADPLKAARHWQGRVLGLAGALAAPQSAEASVRLTTEEAVRTSAIEGEALDRAAVRSSVARRLGVPTAGLPAAPRHVDGLVEVLLDATQNHTAPVTLDRLCRWQAALFPTGQSGLTPIRVGSLRGAAPMRVVSGPVGRERVHFEAPPNDLLATELSRFLDWLESPADTDGLVRAGLAHLWFVTLHPFEDGNGRLARALTDLVIARDDGRDQRWFSLSAQLHRERESYYTQLETTQRGGLEVTRWLVWFLSQVRAAAEGATGLIEATVAKARFWQRFADADLNARQRKVLNRMLDAEPAGFEGGLTNRKYVSLTGTSRQTAQRELAHLVDLGCLVPSGQGRGRAYVLPSAN